MVFFEKNAVNFLAFKDRARRELLSCLDACPGTKVGPDKFINNETVGSALPLNKYRKRHCANMGRRRNTCGGTASTVPAC
jgi:hypothetical protein